jgi:hypothetical protein
VADVIFILILVAFFALCLGYVRVCDLIIGPDVAMEDADEDVPETGADVQEVASA